MGWANWKRFERDVAKVLGGMRRVRIQYSESCEDVHHDTLAIECKYGLQVPKTVMVKYPTLYNDDLVLIPSKYLYDMLMCLVPKRGQTLKFVLRGMAQASKYNDDKIPVLCLKRPRVVGFVMCMWLDDFTQAFQGKPPTLRYQRSH